MEYKKDDIKRKIVMLSITEHCNLDCVYCFEKSKTKKLMDIDTAKKAIIDEFENSDGFEELEIDIFGGEPTLRKKFIIDLVEWTYTQNFSKPYLFFIETNGTLMDENFKKWLLKNIEYVWIGLSLDGTRETHNKNRSNSYDDIDIDFFVKNYPGQSVRMTVYKTTINNLSNDIIHLHNLGFTDVTATFANGIDWEIEKYKDIISAELIKLVDFYIKNPKLKVCTIFDMPLIEVLEQKEKIEKWCGAGTSMVSYSYDGKKYPCQTFQPNTTGANIKSLEIDDINFIEINDFSDPECAGCIIEPICSNCYGINYIERGDILKRDKGLCKITKLRALATSILEAKRIENGISDLPPNEIYQMIEAIEIIQNNVKL